MTEQESKSGGRWGGRGRTCRGSSRAKHEAEGKLLHPGLDEAKVLRAAADRIIAAAQQVREAADQQQPPLDMSGEGT